MKSIVTGSSSRHHRHSISTPVSVQSMTSGNILLQTFLYKSYFYTPVVRRNILCYGVVHPSEVISVFQTFFFAATALKFGLLLCSKELQFHFAFQCDWSIFARVLPMELRRLLEFLSFADFFCHLCRYKVETSRVQH
jgi:hypothetical protein